MPAPGDIIDRYELVSPLGRGGMGEVWRAVHTGLKTPVALKLLRRRASNQDAPEGDRATHLDDQEVERFLREARAAAHLRGAHVVQVFDVGVDGDTPFIAMELLDGEPLDRRLDRLGILPPTEVARIMDQVGRAVARAHAEGIIHRDLKPANIFLIDDGDQVKVLDFGIAKITTASAVDSASEDTATGAMLGTPFYMSPEQIRGHEIDHHTDLWSMAVIAYELLVGARPFAGDTMGDLVMRICVEEPPLPSEVGDVPEGFDGWFARGTAKAQEDRFDDVSSLIDALHAALGTTAPESVIASSTVAPPTRPRFSRVTWAAGGAALLVGALVVSRGERPVERTTVATATAAPTASASVLGEGDARPITFHGRVRIFAQTPDGEQVVYALPREQGATLYVKRGQEEPRALADTTWVFDLDVSPDGRRVLVCEYLSFDAGRAYTLLLEGPADVPPRPERIDAQRDWAHEAAWARDGQHYAVLPQSYVDYVVLRGADGSFEKEVSLEVPEAWRRTSRDEEGLSLRRSLRHLDLSPEGDEVMLTAVDGTGEATLLIQPVAGGKAKTLAIDGLVAARYGPDRRHLWVATRDDVGVQISRLELDVDGRPRGGPELVAKGLSSTGRFDVSRAGTLAYVHFSAQASLVRIEHHGARRELTRGVQRDLAPALSPDGGQVAFVRYERGRGARLMLIPSEGGEVRAVHDTPVKVASPAWSPNGRRLAFVAADDTGRPSVWLTSLSGRPKLLEPSPRLAASRDLSWAPGRELLVHTAGGINYSRIDPDTGATRKLLADPQPVAIRMAISSRTNRVAAFRAGEDFGLAAEGPSGWKTFASQKIYEPLAWNREGDVVFARSGDEVLRIDVTTGEETPWLSLGLPEVGSGDSLSHVSITADGEVVVASDLRSQRDVHQLTLP